MEVTITKENFEQVVLKSDKPVLVDFWATWCGPCKMLSPIIEEVRKETEGKAVVGKINVDEQQEGNAVCAQSNHRIRQILRHLGNRQQIAEGKRG